MGVPRVAIALGALLLLSGGGAPTLLVAPDECAKLAREAAVPPADVEPGLDVRGRRVVAADGLLADGSGGLGRELLAAARIVIGVPTRLRGVDVYVGTFGFDAGGRLLLNGRPVAPSERQRLAAACSEALTPRR